MLFSASPQDAREKIWSGDESKESRSKTRNWDVGSGTRLDVYFVALATRNQGGFY